MLRFDLVCLFTVYTCLAKDQLKIELPNQGTIIGTEISMIRTKKIRAFLGIPYAEPPVGNLRFTPPVIEPLPSWEGVRNATKYAPACLQSESDYNPQDLLFMHLISEPEETYLLDEDCLYLNVFVPSGKSANKGGYATIVWLHPGNFTTGNPALWNPYTLVYRNKVVVVTVAWRMNILGFFSTMDGEAAGNYGLMDQQAAMQWVKSNIKLFGGDPNNICLMGYGTGAMSVGLHMVNPQSRDLFDKAIAMSGNFLNPSAVKYPQEDRSLLDNLASTFGCFHKPTSLLVDCLRQVDAKKLVQYTSNINWRPLIDVGLSNNTLPFLTELPRNFFERGDFHKVPFLTGYTEMEDVLSIEGLLSENATQEELQGIFNEVITRDVPSPNSTNSEFCSVNSDFIANSILFFYGPSIPTSDEYRKLVIDFTTEKYYASSTILHASYLSRYNNNTYVYRFDLKPTTPEALEGLPGWVSVPHLFDLIYVWGIPYWGPITSGQVWDNRDKSISDIIMGLWANFAKYSSPTKNSPYAIKWDAFDTEDPKILMVDGTFTMSNSSKLNYKALEFWNDYYPRVLEVSTVCCNSTESGGSGQNFNPGVHIMFTATFGMLRFII